MENNLKKMASVEAKTDTVINDEENEDADIGEEVTDDGKTAVAKKSKKKKKPKKPSKLKRMCPVKARKYICKTIIGDRVENFSKFFPKLIREYLMNLYLVSVMP